MGFQFRNIIIARLFKKLLKLKGSLVEQGKLINMIENDTQKFVDLCVYWPYTIFGPLELVVSVYFVISFVGPYAALVGIGVILMLIPIQFLLSRRTGILRQRALVSSDKIIQNISQIIQGIVTIKYNAWEPAFLSLIKSCRCQKYSSLISSGYFKVVNEAMFPLSPIILSGSITIVLFLTSTKLQLSSTYTAIALLVSVRTLVVQWMPRGVESFYELSCDRIQTFLDAPEYSEPSSDSDANLQTSLDSKGPSPDQSESPQALRVHSLTLKMKDGFFMDDLNFTFQMNQISMIFGPVGSGKSLLFLSILNEVAPQSGRLFLNGQIAYASQSPWILKGTIRANILLGRPFDEALYGKVLFAAAIGADLQKLPNGDEFFVAEGGTNLSGGQRARLSLARTLYSLNECSIFLLDDVLSALDGIVASQVMERMLKFLKGKCVILATHQIEFARLADQIILLDKGRSVFTGSFSEFRKSKGLLTEIIKETTDASHEEPQSMASTETKATKFEQAAPPISEMHEDSRIRRSALKAFIQLLKATECKMLVVAMFSAALLAQASMLFLDQWITKWTSLDYSQQKNILYPSVLGAAAFGTIFLFILRGLLVYRVILKSTNNLFSSMTAGVLFTNLNFFHVNPAGRILNRFTKDHSVLEDTFPQLFLDGIQSIMIILAAVIIVLIINPVVIVSLVAIMPGCIYFRNKFSLIAKQVKGLENSSRSPYLQQVAAASAGLVVLRSFKKEQFFLEDFFKYKNQHSTAALALGVIARWLASRIDLLSNFFFACTCFASLIFRESLTAQQMTLSLTYAMQLLGLVQWAIRCTTDIEVQMASMDRVLEYCQLKREETADENLAISADWPEKGSVEFHGLSLTYPEQQQPILKQITLKVRPGEKIGIVGRTGAGKSSIMAALFRIVEAEPRGCLIIDNEPADRIPLGILRSRMSMIPQEAVLFKQSLRFNLDPSGTKSDFELWNSLKMVNLSTKLCSKESKLDSVISEEIALSSGEKQLLCLARALLRQSKIILMDEATANIDHETSAFIQTKLNDLFASSTVFTIAHRVSTIIEYDRVVVLHQGEIVECGSPHELLESGGRFSRLVQELGAEAERDLRRIAAARQLARE